MIREAQECLLQCYYISSVARSDVIYQQGTNIIYKE
jgi:hypothetical protein